MNTTERQQMIEALYQALQWAHEYGNLYGQPRVVLTESSEITKAVSQDGQYGADIVGPIWSINDLLGPSWDEGLDESDSDAVDAVLREAATWWVDDFGADALDDARYREDEQWSE